MKARDLLTIIERYAEASRMTTEKLLEEVPNDKFKLIVQSTATLFKHLKEEAIRRGIWDELRGDEAMTEEMPQAFADAFCNLVLKEFQKTDQEWAHVRNRYRGIEGKNGVCCEACKGEAHVLWVEYQRILEGMKL